MKNTTSTKAWILCLMVFVLTIVLMSHAVHGQNITYNYSKSILTNFVNPSDYPAANVASFGSNVKLYWKLLKNEKSTNINDAILEFGAIGRRQTGYLSFCFACVGTMRGDTMFGFVNTANQQVTIVDAYMVGEPNPPTSDGSDDFIQRNGGYKQVAGVNEIHLKWTRFVKTNDTANDATFTNSNMRLNWAVHSSLTIMKEHSSEGQNVLVNFLSTGFATGEYGELPKPPSFGSGDGNSSCTLPTGYSQSIMTKWVLASDYPTANKQVMGTYGSGDSLTLYWKILKNTGTGGDIIEFGLVATGIYGYASIGFNHGSGSGMQTADTIFGYIDSSGKAVIIDAWMSGNLAAPAADTKQDIIMKNGGIRQVSGNYEVHLKWTRLLDTKDTTSDTVFKNAAMPCSWAVSKTQTGISAVHSYRDKGVMINFLQTVATTDIGAAPGSDLAACGNNATGIVTDTALNDLMTANSYRWHLIITAIVFGSLVLCGFILTILAPRIDPNLFFDLILYRRASKLVTTKIVGEYFTNNVLNLTLGELIVIISYWILVVVWFVYGFLNATSVQAGKAFASVCVFNFGLILFPVTRYSILQVLFGISFDRAIKYHRWIGILQWWFVTAHGVAMVIEYTATNAMYLVSDTNPTFPILGIVAWFLMTILWAMTFPVIRRKLWEVFLFSHVILSIIIVVLSIVHGSGYITLLPYMGLSIALYAVDWALRLLFGFGVPTEIVNMEYNEAAEVTTITMRKQFLTFGSNPSHGHFVFLYIPGVSLFQHHPATVSSCKKLDACVKWKKTTEFTVHIRNFQTGWSKRVAEVAKEQTELKKQAGNEDKLIKFCRVEGTYGNLSVPLLKYKTIVMFAGGIGVTPVNALYSDLLDTRVDKRVYYSWSIRTEDMIPLFPNLLRDGGKNFRPHIFVSQKPKDLETADPRIIHSRANPKEFLEKVKKELKEQGIRQEYVGVLVCGPDAFITSVTNAVWDSNESGGIRFHLHKEVFSW